MGLSGNHPERVKAAILYTLETTCLSEGHTYIETEKLIIDTQSLLNQSAREGQRITEMDAANAIIALGENKDIVIEDGRCYFPSLFYAEQNVAKRVKHIASQTEYDDQFPESEFLLALGELEERMNVQYAPSQKEAIQKPFPHRCFFNGDREQENDGNQRIVELYGELHGVSLDPSAYKRMKLFRLYWPHRQEERRNG